MVEEMKNVTHEGVLIMLKHVFCLNKYKHCEFYVWDSNIVSEELNMFSELFKATHSSNSFEDVLQKAKTTQKKKMSTNQKLKANPNLYKTYG